MSDCTIIHSMHLYKNPRDILDTLFDVMFDGDYYARLLVHDDRDDLEQAFNSMGRSPNGTIRCLQILEKWIDFSMKRMRQLQRISIEGDHFQSELDCRAPITCQAIAIRLVALDLLRSDGVDA